MCPQGRARRLIRSAKGDTITPIPMLSHQSVFLFSVLFAGAVWAQPAGDVARGKVLFEDKGQCLSCHRVNGNGSRMGPDLSEMGIPRRAGGPGPAIETLAAGNAAALERKILDPDAEVAPANRFVHAVTKDGVTVTGRLLNRDNFTVQLIDNQGKLRSYAIGDLREFSLVTKSQMPSYKDKLSGQEVADLVSYLLSLKGLGK
jgi:putative heme-binding domain-containing protein